MIIISAGHNANAPGACEGEFCEYPETALWAGLIMGHLEEVLRAPVELCPSGTLTDKVRWIRERHARQGVQLAVEIHFNSVAGGGARGCETLYYPGSESGKWYAQRVNAAMADSTRDRGIKEGWYRMDRPGIIDYQGDKDGDETPDYFLKATPCPALILEPEFIQNRAWIIKNRSRVCVALAEAIYEAVEEWHSPMG